MDGLTPSSTQALVRLDAIPAGNWERFLEECLRVSSTVLAVESVSYWQFRARPPSIVCELGYRVSGDRLERGFIIAEPACPQYFGEIRLAPMLAIEDAAHDPRSAELGPYLKSRGIGALLDTAVRLGGKPVGILCHEHAGEVRSWTNEEQQFAFGVSQLVANRLQARERSDVEESARRTALLADVMMGMSEQFGARAASSLAVERALPALGDMAVLVAFDAGKLSYVAGAHVDPDKSARLDQIYRLYPPTLEGPEFASHAIREQQSLLVPSLSPEVLRSYGIDEERYARLRFMRVRSAMAVPFNVRGDLRGAMVFASSSRRYDPNDLRYAEAYAQRVGLILENARLYRTAQEAIRARDEFLSLASHELRTPLATLHLFAQVLARELASMSGRPVAEMSERMVRQIARLDRLTDRLLNASEIEETTPSIDRERVDIVEVVDDVCHAFQSLAEAAGSSLVLSSGGRVIASVDPIRVQQVVGNLIDNAIKFGNGQPIEVGVEAVDGVAMISVHDHGPGIPPEEQRQLGSRFQRGGAAKGVGGLGLGLYIVRAIVEAHGGRLRVESEPGRGSTFTVELPLAEPVPAPVPRPAEQEAPP